MALDGRMAFCGHLLLHGRHRSTEVGPPELWRMGRRGQATYGIDLKLRDASTNPASAPG